MEAEQKAQSEAEARAKTEVEVAARAAAEAQRQAADEAKRQAEAHALVTEAEEAVRQESAAVKRQMEAQQREEDDRRVREAEELGMAAEQQERLLADMTAQSLADERAKIEAAAIAREEQQVRARDDANAKARAEMEEALRREQALLKQEENEESRLREEAEARALAAAQTVSLPFFVVRKRKPWRFDQSWKKSIAVAAVLFVVVGVTLAHLLPFNFYIPTLEQQLTASLGQRVSIQSLHFSAYPAPHLELSGVVVGDKVGARIGQANLFPAITSWFSDVKLIRRVELDSVTISADSFDAFPRWSQNQARTVPFQIERILVKNGKFNHLFLDAFTFDAEMDVRRGRFAQAKVNSTDQRISMNFLPQADALRIDLSAKQSVLPFEPRLPLESLKVSAVAQKGKLMLNSIEAQLFGGYASGVGSVNWTKGWAFNTELGLQQIEMAPALATFSREAKLTGTLEAKLRLAGQAETLANLFESPQAQATFRVKNGDYVGVDLVRAIQAPSRAGQSGGKTNFSDLSGYFQMSKGRFTYRQIKLQGGLVSANGNLDVAQDHNLSGSLFAELQTPSARFRSSFVFAGDLAMPLLKLAPLRAAPTTPKIDEKTERLKSQDESGKAQ